MQLFNTTVLVVLALLLSIGILNADTPAKTATLDSGIAVVQDSGYYQFKLDSMKQENDAHLRIVREGIGGGDNTVQVMGVFVPIVLFIGMAIVLVQLVVSSRKVKLAMVEKGMDPSLLKQPHDESSKKFSALRLGLLIAGIGLGLLIGWYIAWATQVEESQQFFITLGCSLSLGGVGLAMYHIIVRKIEKDK
ncbi:MAG: hypothetical protein HQ472_02650 [Ignavibacteria bacterium]|nr:hypothetical protein [Ignavibacteria bacterium]